MTSFQEIPLGWPFAGLGATEDILVSFFRDDRKVCKSGAWYPFDAVARYMMIIRRCIPLLRFRSQFFRLEAQL